MNKIFFIALSVLILSAFSMSAQNTWEEITPVCDTCPPPLQGHTMVSFINKIYMFGGMNNSKSVFNHISVYDTEQRWIEEQPLNTPPPPRYKHKAIKRDNNKMYIFFGQGTSQKLDDVWYYDINTKTWHELLPASPKPVARTEFTAIVNGELVWIFGGRDENGNILSDLWAFNLADNAWEVYPSYSGSGLYGHVSGANDLNIYFFGGYNNLGLNSEMITYNKGNATWSTVTPQGDVPPPTANSVFIPFTNYMAYVYSGTTENGITGNCYQWNLLTNTFVNYATGPALEFTAGAYIDNTGDIPDKENDFENFVIYGGFNGTDIIDTTWAYTTDIEIPASILNIDKTANKLYPNPNAGSFYIEIQEKSQVQMFNALGTIIYSNSFENGTHALEFSELPAGVYYLKTNGKKNMRVLKIIIKE